MFGGPLDLTDVKHTVALKEFWEVCGRYFGGFHGEENSDITLHHEKFSLLDMQRIAQAVLHFEDAMEITIQADVRQGGDNDETIRRIGADNPRLAGLRPAQRIDRVTACRSIQELKALINPLGGEAWRLECPHPRNYPADTNRILPGVMFRWWPSFRSADDGDRKIDLVMRFLTAAVRCPDPGLLQTIPPTVAGMLHFTAHPLWIKVGANAWTEQSRDDWMWSSDLHHI